MLMTLSCSRLSSDRGRLLRALRPSANAWPASESASVGQEAQEGSTFTKGLSDRLIGLPPIHAEDHPAASSLRLGDL
jgi:hypothetical protein